MQAALKQTMQLLRCTLLLSMFLAVDGTRITTETLNELNSRGLVEQPQQKAARTRLPVENVKKTIRDHLGEASFSSSNPKKCFRQEDTGPETRENLAQSCSTPKVPEDLFRKTPFCRQGVCQKRETGMVIAENILARFAGDFDVAILHADACSQYHTLAPGNLTKEHVNRMIPIDEPLVGLRLNATDFMKVLLQGLTRDDKWPDPEDAWVPSFLRNFLQNQGATCKKGPVDRFPVLAGVKLEITTQFRNGKKGIYGVRVLSDECEWLDLDMDASYSILTTESLSFGTYGYSAMTNSFSYWNTGQTLREAFWQQAQSNCSVQQPIAHTVDSFYDTLYAKQMNQMKPDLVQTSQGFNASHVTRRVGGQASI
mmetsp:Transcript_16320/g.38563  ORF Transcript_16320/g.38563 Transcript_16320/m.38563 type:complete len:369 (-) Transcript_16320:47-1153(-)